MFWRHVAERRRLKIKKDPQLSGTAHLGLPRAEVGSVKQQSVGLPRALPVVRQLTYS